MTETHNDDTSPNLEDVPYEELVSLLMKWNNLMNEHRRTEETPGAFLLRNFDKPSSF